MLEIGVLVVSLGIILLSAELFTNGVEWLGKRLGLSEGAVGSILAAVGTALPETLVPIIAIVFGSGSEADTEIGIGAILGAPFMLGTLALFITGVAGIVFRRRRNCMVIKADPKVMSRDLGFFLVVYAAAIGAAFFESHTVKLVVAVFLVAAYVAYAYFTITHSDGPDDGELGALLFARKQSNPSTGIIVVQVLVALLGIVIGAHFFVDSIKVLAEAWGIAPLVLSLIITPIATELPEKFNSVIWMSKSKDTLALGNITGAMVFQSSIIPAIGILLTPWSFTWPNMSLVSAILALLSAGLIFILLKTTRYLRPQHLLLGGVFYITFLVVAFTGFI